MIVTILALIGALWLLRLLWLLLTGEFRGPMSHDEFEKWKKNHP